jgi:hypothetical protein
VVEELGATNPALGHTVHGVDVGGFVKHNMGVAFMGICVG